jgi:tetratricopeptide (TPR) repeat protein
MSRLSRKDVKRDEVLETVGKTVDYARDHSRTILLAVVAVVVAALGYAAFVVWSAGRGERANESLAEALRVVRAEIDPYDPQPSGDPPKFADQAARDARARELLEGVRSGHSGTSPADVATSYLAGMAARAGQLDQARELWEEIAADPTEHLLAAEARVNLMALDREQGRLRELADEIRAELDSAEPSLPQPLLLHHLAGALEGLGLREEAREVYLRLAEEHPDSAYAASAQRRGALL